MTEQRVIHGPGLHISSSMAILPAVAEVSDLPQFLCIFSEVESHVIFFPLNSSCYHQLIHPQLETRKAGVNNGLVALTSI